MSRSITGGEIDPVAQRLIRKVAPDILPEERDAALPLDRGQSRVLPGQDYIRAIPRGRIAGEWLGIGHIETGTADPARIPRGDQRTRPISWPHPLLFR